MFYNIKQVKTLSHHSGVLIALPRRPNSADRRGAHCVAVSYAVCASCALQNMFFLFVF